MEGKVIYLNRAFTRVFGWSLEQQIGKKIDNFVPDENWPETKMMIHKVTVLGESFSGLETRRYTKSGNILDISISGSCYRDPEGNIAASVINLRDITEQKKFESRLQETQKMEAIATLAGGIAHKFNNALSGITGNADLLEMEFPGDDRVKRYITPMKQSALQMAHLSAQLLAYARGGKYNPEIISPTDLVKDTLPLIEHTVDPNIRIETDLPSDIMSIEADNTQMQMVLSAIIANANDAIEDKGRIRITAKDVEIDEAFSKARPALRPGPYIALTLEDDGKGMDEETKARIFEPFFTTHFMGRGLGLAAVYGIIRNHDGWITVDSELGKGTKVVIYLPVTSAESKAQGAEAIKQPEIEAVSGAGTVLIIEDEEIVLDVTKAMIEALGYHVLTAKTGKEAISVTETFDGDIDLALLDIKLPDMEGGRVYRHIMEVRPDLKVIVCSGYTIEGPAQEILNAGAQGFIHKPASLGVLSDEVKRVLGD
ncbi:MAG: response regulator [Deltaproteobacteria bacterium]|nr:response regulator [Deltaproteobacteria bacterium]